MNGNFIKNIEIEKYKCFNDFKANDFKRVNLIGGYNNVGKTTFLEACYLSITNSIEELYQNLVTIRSNRNIVNILININAYNDDIRRLIQQKKFKIMTNNSLTSYETQDDKYIIKFSHKEYKKTYSELSDLIQSKVAYRGWSFYSNFLSSGISEDSLSKKLIDNLKKTNRYDELNKYLKDIFNIYNIDIIDNEPNIKKTKENTYIPLSSFGQGLKSFINIILSLLGIQKYIFIDEIENGIHYTLYDKIWEIIFKISKERNIQVFVTTHSKECLESYCQVSKQLEENNISYINLSTNENNDIIAITLDSDMLRSEVGQNHEVRAW